MDTGFKIRAHETHKDYIVVDDLLDKKRLIIHRKDIIFRAMEFRSCRSIDYKNALSEFTGISFGLLQRGK